jgi:hypothetical protein
MTKEDRDAEIKRLWETTDTSMTQIALQFGMTRGQVGGMIRRGGWVSFVKGRGGVPKGIPKPRRVPGEPPKKRPRLPSRQGKLRARTYKPRGGEPRTLFDRCQALHDTLDAVLKANPIRHMPSPTGRSTG